jgi:hypothetical protein
MNVVDEMRNWKGKSKELVTFLTESIKKDEKLFSQLIEILKTGSDVEKGTCADVMKHISKDKPSPRTVYTFGKQNGEIKNFTNFHKSIEKKSIKKSENDVARILRKAGL